MKNLLFFPPACITQVGDDSFRINDIYGGVFDINKEIASVYLSQGNCYEYGEPNKINLPAELYDSVINALINNKIIYISSMPKEKSFNGQPIIEKIASSKFEKERTLSIGDVTLELTQDCPYRCEGCFRELNRDEYLALDKIRDLLRNLRSMGLTKLSLSGGEITSNRSTTEKAKKVIDYASSIGITTIRLLTTGFNSKRLEELIDRGLTELQISVDGNELSHNNYKKSDRAYHRAIEAIKMCSGKRVRLTSNTVVTKDNLHTLEGTIDKLTEYNIDTIRINKIITKNQNLRLTLEEAKKLYKTVLKKQMKHGKRIINTYGDCINKLNCVAGITYAHIGSTGNVFPCDYITTSDASNINESSFEEIWTNSDLIKLFRKPKNVSESCKNCKERSFCIGNCIVEANNLKTERGCYYG